MSKEISRETLYSAKWINLTKIKYKDPNNTEREWECAQRTTRKDSIVDGVELLARVCLEGQEPKIILVRQYRPPLASTVIEFPAGLVDENEDPEVAAARELLEETGYKGKVVGKSSQLALEPGMTNEMEITDPPSQQQLQQDEFIDVLLVPVSKFYDTLMGNQAYR